MKKIFLAFIPFLLIANDLENKPYTPEKPKKTALSFSIQPGYSSYIIDVTSGELNSAINYDVVDITIGSSYSYNNRWLFGVDGKFFFDEQNSQMQIDGTNNKLNDIAEIDRKEFSIYTNYSLDKDEHWRLNIIYRFSSLNATDSFKEDGKTYSTDFNYNTRGLSSSIFYINHFDKAKKHFYYLNGGVVFSQADIDISEKNNDAFIDDSSQTLGFKFGLGYKGQIIDNLFFDVKGDMFRYNFGKLNVKSKYENSNFSNATLKEEIYSFRVGLSYSFGL